MSRAILNERMNNEEKKSNAKNNSLQQKIIIIKTAQHCAQYRASGQQTYGTHTHSANTANRVLCCCDALTISFYIIFFLSICLRSFYAGTGKTPTTTAEATDTHTHSSSISNRIMHANDVRKWHWSVARILSIASHRNSNYTYQKHDILVFLGPRRCVRPRNENEMRFLFCFPIWAHRNCKNQNRFL